MLEEDAVECLVLLYSIYLQWMEILLQNLGFAIAQILRFDSNCS